MHPPEFSKFIDPPAAEPAWFQNRPPMLGLPWDWLQQGLNLGITNIFDFPEGKTNCTDVNTVFGAQLRWIDPFWYDAVHNFWSCAFYPNLTRDVREFRLEDGNRTFLLDRKMDVNVASSANVAHFLSTCLVTFCENSKTCRTPSCTMGRLIVNESMLAAFAVDDCLTNICDNEPERSSNPDIAGIGAVSSYMIQFGISIVAFFSLAICVWMLGRVLKDPRPKPEAYIVKRVARIQVIIETLLITLDDFQRAQCCFAIAIDIASMITLQTKAGNITQQDRIAIRLASTAGIAPTTMILAGLMALNDRHSALTFWLTFFTWIFSLAVGFHPETRKQTVYTGSSSSQYPKACGGISPALICGFQRNEDFGLRFTMFAPIVSMPLLLAWHLWPTAVGLIQKFSPQRNCRPTPKLYTGLSMNGTNIQAVRLRIDRFTIAAVIIVYLSGLVSIISFITVQALNSTSGDVNREWTFGQIVAIVVWLPSLLSFVNDIVYGPLRGRTEQLPDTIELVRVPMVHESSDT